MALDITAITLVRLPVVGNLDLVAEILGISCIVMCLGSTRHPDSYSIQSVPSLKTTRGIHITFDATQNKFVGKLIIMDGQLLSKR